MAQAFVRELNMLDGRSEQELHEYIRQHPDDFPEVIKHPSFTDLNYRSKTLAESKESILMWLPIKTKMMNGELADQIKAWEKQWPLFAPPSIADTVATPADASAFEPPYTGEDQVAFMIRGNGSKMPRRLLKSMWEKKYPGTWILFSKCGAD